jgi:hypothetical protein
MPSERPHFSCPQCGSKKVWKPEIAGRTARCGCGNILKIPAEQPGMAAATVVRPRAAVASDDPFEAAAAEAAVAGEDGQDELVPAPAAPAATRGRKSGGGFVPPEVVIEREEADGSVHTVGAVPRTLVRAQNPALLTAHKRLKREEKEPEPEASVVRDYVLPGILIALGVYLCFLDGQYKGTDGGWQPLDKVVGPVLLNMAASLAFAVGAVFAASAMGGVAFTEPVPIVIYKLCGVALVPGAIGSLALNYIGGINGSMAGTFLALACLFVLFMLLFRMSMEDRVVCVMLMFIIRAGVQYLAWRFQGIRQGSDI